MVGNEFVSSGVTAETPKNILMDSGTIHKGLKYNKETKQWNGVESLYSSTSGGSKLSIVPNLVTPEIDGVHVNVEGLTQKYGETATLEVNIAEIKPDALKSVALLEEAESDVEGYVLLNSKAKIEKGDYLEDFAFVGKTMEGLPIIVLFEKCLCTSGFETSTSSQKNAAYTAKFECYAKAGTSTDKLPYHIYYPTLQTEEAIPPQLVENGGA